MNNGRIPKASDLVVNAIRRRILLERLPVGFRLPTEAELVEEFGLGRMTVREALRLLERDGLVEIKRGPGGGVTVRHPGIGQVSEAMSLLFSVQNVTLREFVEFRCLLEPAAARLAAIRGTPDQVQAILNSVELEDQSPAGSVVDMHLSIGAAAENGVLRLVLQSMQGPMNIHFRAEKIRKSDLAGTAKAHRKIAETIAAGDPDGAERAMRLHLEAYYEYLEEVGLIDEPIVPGVPEAVPY